MLLNHIAVIVSSEDSVDFYKDIGFEEIERTDRKYDQIVMMKGNGTALEIFVDPTHPKRVTNPEANGLRHICFETEHVDKLRNLLSKYNPEEIKGNRFFVKDPDGQPIEFKEYIPKAPEGNYSFDG